MNDSGIKFRAWHTSEKKMYEWESIDGLQDFGSLWNLLNGDLWQYKIMQFSGLQDKNCKDIYEYDIIKNVSCDRVGIIIYDSSKCYYNVVDLELYQIGIRHNCDMINVPGGNWLKSDIEVIGNKYNNKELLK